MIPIAFIVISGSGRICWCEPKVVIITILVVVQTLSYIIVRSSDIVIWAISATR